MAAKYWIKLYHEILHERKMAQLSDRLWRRAVECFLFAGEENNGGILPRLDDMAWALRQTPEVLETELAELARIGLVEQRAGGWFVTNFAKRQAKMDKAEYMRRLRDERQKGQYYSGDSEPLPDSYDNRYQPVTNSNADTDTDTDKMQMKKGATAPGVNGGDILNQSASKALVDWWTRLTGGGKPWGNDAQADYYGPAEALLERLDNDVPRAKELLEEKRGEMIRDGKTPKRLSAVAFYIVADLDGETIPTSSPITDFKVYHDPKD